MKATDHPHVSVSFTSDTITVCFRHDEEPDWDKDIKWSDIIRVCYETYDYGAPDFIYIYLDESYDAAAAIPVTETGGEELWKEIKKRKLFKWPKRDYPRSPSHTFDCWPERKRHDKEEV